MRGDKKLIDSMTKQNIETTNKIISNLEKALEKMPNLEYGKDISSLALFVNFSKELNKNKTNAEGVIMPKSIVKYIDKKNAHYIG